MKGEGHKALDKKRRPRAISGASAKRGTGPSKGVSAATVQQNLRDEVSAIEGAIAREGAYIDRVSGRLARLESRDETLQEAWNKGVVLCSQLAERVVALEGASSSAVVAQLKKDREAWMAEAHRWHAAFDAELRSKLTAAAPSPADDSDPGEQAKTSQAPSFSDPLPTGPDDGNDVHTECRNPALCACECTACKEAWYRRSQPMPPHRERTSHEEAERLWKAEHEPGEAVPSTEAQADETIAGVEGTVSSYAHQRPDETVDSFLKRVGAAKASPIPAESRARATGETQPNAPPVRKRFERAVAAAVDLACSDETGHAPTPYCDSCAHARCAELEVAVTGLQKHIHELALRVVANAGRGSPNRKQRWAHVKDATGYGSTRSQQLCRDVGFDPDEEVGGDD